ncbi:hypothetical protein SDC9_188921 [bioreactor metagenome]|uniref:Uncharacterized protein n=1 Tax=bioreactor metagenome TaxID=1076179 RepID=A0A645HQN7_9ZZZZ
MQDAHDVIRACPQAVYRIDDGFQIRALGPLNHRLHVLTHGYIAAWHHRRLSLAGERRWLADLRGLTDCHGQAAMRNRGSLHLYPLTNDNGTRPAVEHHTRPATALRHLHVLQERHEGSTLRTVVRRAHRDLCCVEGNRRVGPKTRVDLIHDCICRLKTWSPQVQHDIRTFSKIARNHAFYRRTVGNQAGIGAIDRYA